MSAAASVCRSCGAPIEWAITVNGRRIPLDLGEHEGGNLEVRAGVAYNLLPPPPRARRAHFATCPNADRHRKRGKP